MRTLTNLVTAKAGKGTMVRNTMVLAGGTVLAQAIPLLFMLVFARLFSNASFGIYNLFYQVAMVLGAVANGRLEQPVLAEKQDKQAAALVPLAMRFNVGFSAICLLLSGVFYFYFPENNISQGLGLWIFLVPVSVFMSGLILMQGFVLNRWKQYGQMAAAKVMQVAVANLVSLVLVFVYPEHAAWLIIGLLTGQVAAILYFRLWVLRRHPMKPGPSSGKSSSWIKMLKHYRQFPMVNAPAILVDQLAGSVPLLFVAWKYGNDSAGDFGLAMRILIVPAVLVSASVAQVFYKHAVDTVHAKGKMDRLLAKTGLVLFLIGVLPFGLLMLAGPQLVSFVFGAKWEFAGVICAWLAVSGIVKFAVSPLSSVFVVVGRIKLQAVWQALWLAANLVLVVASHHFNLALITYLQLLVASDILLYILYYLMMVRTVKAYVRV